MKLSAIILDLIDFAGSEKCSSIGTPALHKDLKKKKKKIWTFGPVFFFAHVLLGLRPRSTFAKKCWLHLIGLRPSRTRERRSDDLITRTDTLRPVLLPYEYTSDGDAIV